MTKEYALISSWFTASVSNSISWQIRPMQQNVSLFNFVKAFTCRSMSKPKNYTLQWAWLHNLTNSPTDDDSKRWRMKCSRRGILTANSNWFMRTYLYKLSFLQVSSVCAPIKHERTKYYHFSLRNSVTTTPLRTISRQPRPSATNNLRQKLAECQ